jgi:hypothetical protein
MANKTKTLRKKEEEERGKEVVRVTFRFYGPELAQIRDVREMLSLNSEVDAARYLMQRGLEAMMPILVSRRVQGQMKEVVNLDAVINKMKDMGYVPELPK